MLTVNEFISEWQRLHHPSMDVSGDTAFYYQVYVRLHRLIGEEARRHDKPEIFSLLLYTENIIAVGLDGVYEYMYRSLGDVVIRWCRRAGMKADAASQVHRLVSEVVADAPGSAFRQWIIKNVLSHNFQRLNDVLTWLAREDQTLRLVYPDLHYREAMFLRFTGSRQAARQMLWSDMAFNWRDKRGNTLSGTLARQCRLSAFSADEQESILLQETAQSLDTICPERLDTYTVVERKDSHTLVLRHRDGRVFRDVTFSESLPEDVQNQCLAAQLVSYSGKTRANGFVRWIGREEQPAWNGDGMWNDLVNKEKEAARRTCFTTSFGKKLSLYEDLYAVSEDPVKACYAKQGIYGDEANLFDFMAWLRPADSRP